MPAIASNHITYLIATKVVDFTNDTFRLTLMTTGFVFDRDTHEIWADISASEHANENGYTTGGNTLTGISVIEDDVNNRTNITWDNTYWTASGGSIGPSPGGIIRDSTAPGDPVIAYIDFGGEQTLHDGGRGDFINIEFRIDTIEA